MNLEWVTIEITRSVSFTMNEQRIPAYLTLIQKLLTSPRTQADEIINQHLELIDPGFLQLCQTLAEQFQEAGEEDRASFLLNLAQQLGGGIQGQDEGAVANVGGSRSPEDEYLDVLMALLKTKLENPNNPQAIEAVLVQYQDKLDLKFAEVVKEWFQSKIDPNYPERNEAVGVILNNLAIAFYQFPLGTRSHNIEIAVACYECALSVSTQATVPEQWAATQNNLGSAYQDRIQGDKSENLEAAIACYKAALQVYTQEDYPLDWAMTHNNLGNSYNIRVQGDPAQNVEAAIGCYIAAFEVYILEDFPQHWAMTHNNLGNTYRDRTQGDPSENIEQAISCYQNALQIRTRETFPPDWATTTSNLGEAYYKRVQGEKSDNIDQAISCYQNALQVNTREAYPQKWAHINQNLGRAYCDRVKGKKTQNIKQAISYYESALQVYTPDTFPEQAAITQNYLEEAKQQKS
ncbi:tetratricopeptide repeat protein [Oscillatoria acuminata]|nr:tetratricopeptide repeat protein [Oscillatoria acuminata]